MRISGIQRLASIYPSLATLLALVPSSSALSFLLLEGAWDKAEEWVQLTAAERSSLKSQYAKAGISLIVSLFGSTDVPTSTGANPISTAKTMAAWVKQYDLDGVDVDYEVPFQYLNLFATDTTIKSLVCRTSTLWMQETEELSSG